MKYGVVQVIVNCMYYVQCVYFVHFQSCEECEIHYLRLRCVPSRYKIFALSAVVTLVCVQCLSQILLEVGRVLGSIIYRAFLSIAFLPVFVYCVWPILWADYWKKVV